MQIRKVRMFSGQKEPGRVATSEGQTPGFTTKMQIRKLRGLAGRPGGPAWERYSQGAGGTPTATRHGWQRRRLVRTCCTAFVGCSGKSVLWPQVLQGAPRAVVLEPLELPMMMRLPVAVLAVVLAAILLLLSLLFLIRLLLMLLLLLFLLLLLLW